MASSNQDDIQTCAICLEVPLVLKVITKCKHVFCRKCLSNHLRSIGPISERFPCPTCRVESLLPEDGVDGLTDYTGDVNTEAISTDGNTEIETDETENEQIVCKLCRFKKEIEIKADHMCISCHSLYLCKDCTQLHHQNKATKHHLLTPVKKEGEVTCELHEHLISTFCSTCSTPVCPICIQIDHIDHNLISLYALFRAKREEVKCKGAKQEERSRFYQFCQKELKDLHSLSQQRKEWLVATVEESANSCIEHIIEQKTTMKKAIADDFKTIFEITACLDKFPDVTTIMDKLVAKAERMLAITNPSASGLAKLCEVSNELDNTGKLAEQVDREHYLRSFMKVWHNLPYYLPKMQPQDCDLGRLVKKTWGYDKLKIVFQKNLPVPAKHSSNPSCIPCVTNLGNKFYAVAQPAITGQPSDAINIYKYPSTLRKTIRVLVHDMAATLDGNLAVLSNRSANAGTFCSIKLYHPETEFIREVKLTTDFIFLKLFSLAVNLQGQYIILSENGRHHRTMTIFKEDGLILLTHEVEVGVFDIKRTASRIACSAQYIYVMGTWGIAAYEVQENHMTLLMTSNGEVEDGGIIMKDISTTHFDQIAICYNVAKSKKASIKMYELDVNKTILNVNTRDHGKLPKDANSETRLSVKDNYIVSSMDHTIKVYS